jgi:hypothetical protein
VTRGCSVVRGAAYVVRRDSKKRFSRERFSRARGAFFSMRVHSARARAEFSFTEKETPLSSRKDSREFPASGEPFAHRGDVFFQFTRIRERR